TRRQPPDHGGPPAEPAVGRCVVDPRGGVRGVDAGRAGQPRGGHAVVVPDLPAGEARGPARPPGLALTRRDDARPPGWPATAGSDDRATVVACAASRWSRSPA